MRIAVLGLLLGCLLVGVAPAVGPAEGHAPMGGHLRVRAEPARADRSEGTDPTVLTTPRVFARGVRGAGSSPSRQGTTHDVPGVAVARQWSLQTASVVGALHAHTDIVSAWVWARPANRGPPNWRVTA